MNNNKFDFDEVEIADEERFENDAHNFESKINKSAIDSPLIKINNNNNILFESEINFERKEKNNLKKKEIEYILVEINKEQIFKENLKEETLNIIKMLDPFDYKKNEYTEFNNYFYFKAYSIKFNEIKNQKENKLKYFIGNVEDSKKYGPGIAIFENGDYFEGYFKNDKFESIGRFLWRIRELCKLIFYRYVYSNGDYYEGNFKNGLKDGKGIFYWENGNVYNGMWLLDKMEGEGVLEFSNRDPYLKYSGNFKNGKKFGKGILNFSKNTETINYFEGSFDDDVAYGKFIYTKYSENGFWKEDKDEDELSTILYPIERTNSFQKAIIDSITISNIIRFILFFLAWFSLIFIEIDLAASLILFFFFYICYMVAVFSGETFYTILKNKNKPEDLYDYICKLKENQPIYEFKISCFHYEMDDNENQKLVSNFNKSEFLEIKKWIDKSGFLINLDKYFVSKIIFKKIFEFLDEKSKNTYELKKKHFLENNKAKDDLNEFKEIKDINEFQKEIICINRDLIIKKKFKMFFHPIFFIICTTFSLYFVYEIFYQYFHAQIKFNIIKKIKL